MLGDCRSRFGRDVAARKPKRACSFFYASQDRQECGTCSPFATQVPDTAPVAPAHGSAGTMMRRKRRGRSHIVKACPCIPSSAIAEPAPDIPELEITGQNHGERHSEDKAHAKAHNADQKDRAQTAAVSICWERNSEISSSQQSRFCSSGRIRRPNTPFLSNAHCSAPFICRTFTTVFDSAASKNQPGFLRNLGASFRIRVHRRDRQS